MRDLTRRQFIKLGGTAVAAGLLAGCGSTQQQSPTTPTGVPTTSALELTAEVRRSDIIQFYPDVPSKVLHTHHAGVWNGEELVPQALRQMLDASIRKLTDLGNAREAWAALFRPGERVGIKVNTVQYSPYWTHVPLVMAVAACLQEAGMPAEQIVIFDRYTRELRQAGFPISKDGSGVRCYGTDDSGPGERSSSTPSGRYSPGWKILDVDIGLSDILLDCDALVNIPILKESVGFSGVTFALKNHYGTFDKPYEFHQPLLSTAMAELNALPPIRDRTRLIIGDMLEIVGANGPGWQSAVIGDSILMSFDPVATDAVGLQVFLDTLTSEGPIPESVKQYAIPCLESAASLGLGTNDPSSIDLREINLE
jgi:uncharacterized protein (DUF362 family)